MNLPKPTHLEFAEDNALGYFTLRTHKLVAKAKLPNALTGEVGMSISIPLYLDGVNVVLPTIEFDSASIRSGDVEVYNDEGWSCVENVLEIKLNVKFSKDVSHLKLSRRRVNNQLISVRTSCLPSSEASIHPREYMW